MASSEYSSDASIRLEPTKISLDNGSKISLVYCTPKVGSAGSAGLVIAHGVRGSMESFLVSYFHKEMARRGFVTVKFNFPYMEARWRLLRTPDSKQVLVACFRRVLDDFRTRFEGPRKLFIGGVSLGAAVASHVLADEPGRSDVDGLFFLSYPIHKPRRPEELGTKHLFGISKPMLFISGTRDPTGQRDKLEDLVSKLGANAQLYLVEGAAHSLSTGEGRKAYDKTLDGCATELEDWINSQTRS